MQVVENVVRELVLGSFEDDALKLLGLDEAIAVLVKQLECLTDPLALQAAQHLGKLHVVHVVALLLVADVQLRPLAVPIEGDARGALVELVELAEVVILDLAETVYVEQAEGDLVLGVWLC